jgi:putative transcription factor
MDHSIDESLWDAVTVLKNKRKATNSLNKEKRNGNVEAVIKGGVGLEKKQQMYKLDKDTESLKQEKVTLSIGKELSKLRNEKKLSQKELAKQLNIKAIDINTIESGKSLNNKQLISRIRNHLQKK